MYIYLTAVTAFPVIKGSAFPLDDIGEIIVEPCTLHKIGYTCLKVSCIWQCRSIPTLCMCIPLLYNVL